MTKYAQTTCPFCGCDLCQPNHVMVTIALGLKFDTYQTQMNRDMEVDRPADAEGEIVLAECGACEHDLEMIEQVVPLIFHP